MWIRSLPAEGFGRHTKTEWQDWFELEDAKRGANNLQKLMEGPPRRGMPGYASDHGYTTYGAELQVAHATTVREASALGYCCQSESVSNAKPYGLLPAQSHMGCYLCTPAPARLQDALNARAPRGAARGAAARGPGDRDAFAGGARRGGEDLYWVV